MLVAGLAAGGVTSLWAGEVGAADYGLFVDVETEEDLLELLSTGELDQEDFDTLVELLHDGVDLNGADRQSLYALPNLTYAEVDAILQYRKEAGQVVDPVALVGAGILSRRQLTAIAPFLVIEDISRRRVVHKARARYRTTYVAGDEEVPSMWLGLDANTALDLDLGLTAVLTRSWVSSVAYDPNRDALVADGPSVQLHLAKYHVEWENDRWHLIGGTYRIGFGQRLTFDNTNRYTPNGMLADETLYYNQELSRICRQSTGELSESPCSGDRRYQYQSPDYRWVDRLQGVAVGLKRADLGSGWLQAHAFASYQRRNIYQYEIYNTAYCADPRNDDDPYCGAPDVFLRYSDPSIPAPEISYSVLPSVFAELTGGANASYFFDQRAHIGVTGYGSRVDWLVDGLDLDFQEWAKYPYGGPFGALGVDASWGYGVLDLFAEVARSFDSQPAGGGWAAIVRGTVTWKKQVLEAAGRYYGKDFANPYARPIAASDEYNGLRARDEAGLRLRYLGRLGDLDLRTTADFWRSISGELNKLRFQSRGTYEVERWLIPGLWVDYQDKDLAHTGRGDCDDEVSSYYQDEDAVCQGEKITLAAQVKLVPLRPLSLTIKYQHRWLDDESSRFDDSFRQDSSAWLVAMYRLSDTMRLRMRARYLFEDTSSDEYRERSLWTYVEGLFLLAPGWKTKLRYEIYAWLDKRDSTMAREPNPAHWLRLELEYRY